MVYGSGGPPSTTPPPTKSPVVAPTGTPPPTPSGSPIRAVATDDSRLVAYVGNWDACPTTQQVDGYTHIVIAFAVSYTWAATKNNCDAQCNIASTVPICGNQNNQALVDSWRAAGKKVILSFGGAGMGGSWLGWDYCFGEEDALSTALVNIVQAQNFDGIDIDYEYCYDKASNRHWGCGQVTSLYSDTAAQNFLRTMTRLLRQKLDAITPSREYELSHVPMDSDMVTDSPYYTILKEESANLNYVMPQFYNGVTRPAQDGFADNGVGNVSALSIYNNIVKADGIFPGQPNKVVFGFCISQDCINNGSGVTSSQAVSVLQEIKATAEFACNGGAFFWVAGSDTGGSWSDPVSAEVSLTAGCSGTGIPSPTKSPTQSPSKQPSSSPTHNPSKQPTPSPAIGLPGQCSDDTGMCSEADMTQCTCAGRRNLLRGQEAGSESLRGRKGTRMLAKPAPKTSNPTPAPALPSPPPTGSPSKSPTKQPTKSPQAFVCSCILPTPEPTSNPTKTPAPPTSNCSCDAPQKNTCEAICGGGSCRWSGRDKSCGPV
ncbi:hypothetical protein ACHAXR_004990 [Thalassiosira sp. AJA248-18]